MYWRLYYDPAVITRWTVEEFAGVLYHEIAHLLRDHASRMQNFDRMTANLAADAEINDDLLAEGVKLPDGAITPASLGQPNGLLAEEYYAALQARQSAPDQGASAQPGNESTGAGEPEAGDTQQGDGNEAGQEQDSSASADLCDAAQGDGASSADRGGGEEDQPSPSQTAEGGSQADSVQPGNQGDSSGSKAGDSGGTQPSDDKGSMPSSSSGQPSDTSAQPGASSQPPTSPVGNGGAGGQDGRGPGDQAQTPAPGAGRCGSCATGQQEPWEEGPPSDGDGVSRAESELIRRDVARQIKEHCQSRGNVPGHWSRWAEEKLRPKIDWRKELASAVRHAVADVAGASDYSYRRPSRRQGQVGNGKVVLPSLRQPVPEVAVVVDTSGSMSDSMLSQALAEIAGVLKASGLRQGVTVLAVDATVHVSRKVFDARQVQLAGGGGTDMGAGLYAASKLRPLPQVCVVITDSYTPWPDTPPRGMKVIVALTEGGEAPKWAKTIKIGG